MDNKLTLKSALIAFTLALPMALANCGGSGSSAPVVIESPAPVVPPNNPDSIGSVTLKIVVPNKGENPTSTVRQARGSRKPLYITWSVNSITFTQTLSNNASINPTVTLLTVGGASCVASAGADTCTTKLSAPLGQDQWTIRTFASNDGSGNELSEAKLNATIVAGAGNVASLTLNPVVSSLVFVPISGSCNTTDATCLTTVALNALDATGAQIIGSTPFVDAAGNALTIAIGATAHLTYETSSGSAATTSFTNAGANNFAKFAYDGTASGGTTNITATGTASDGSVTPAVFALTLASGITSGAGSTVYIGSNGSTAATLPVTETGYAGTFTATPQAGCSGVVSVGPASGNGPSMTFPIAQVGAGTCTVIVSDTQGGSESVSIVSTTFVATIN